MTQEKKDALEKIKKMRRKAKDYLENLRHAKEYVPATQRAVDEMDTVISVVELMPPDMREEFKFYLENKYIQSDSWVVNNLPEIPEVRPFISVEFTTTSSTGVLTQISGMMNDNNVGDFDQAYSEWVDESTPILGLFAANLSKSNHIYNGMNELSRELGESFRDAENRFEKSRSGNESVSDSLDALRNVIQKFWGELVDKARKKVVNLGKKPPRKHFSNKSENDRVWVFSIIAKAGHESMSMRAMGRLAIIYGEISPNSKNKLYDDFNVLERYYYEWVNLLNDLMDWVE